MPNYSGVWTLQEQFEAITEGNWTGIQLPRFFATGLNHVGVYSEENVEGFRSSPVQVNSDVDWNKISTDRSSVGAATFLIKDDGTLWSQGENDRGQLGHNDLINKSSPVQIGALTNWSQAKANGRICRAIKTDGTIWTWGEGSNGQMGDNNALDRSSPVQIGALTDWVDFVGDNLGSLALNTSGEIYTWGRGNDGELGTDSIINQSSPVQVGALTTWASVGANVSQGRYAVKTDGTLWVWGADANGSLGINTNNIKKSSPVQVGALTDWVRGSGGTSFAVCLKTDNTLWSWGGGPRHGLNNSNDVSSPTQIGSLTNWTNKFVCGHNITLAVTTDGDLYGWGNGNAQGGLGTGDAVEYSSPVQIGTETYWSDAEIGAGGASVGVFLIKRTS